MSDSEATSPFLPLPDGIFISSVRTTTTELVVHIASRQVWAACPLCQQPSERVHGHYRRTVADLPCGGQRVILALTVRKFVCAKPCCPQKIFTERLAELVQSYARMTNRLREALVALGLATSAEVSERLAPSLGMHVSAPTLLRRLREEICPPPKSVRILGVDDWAWKKGQTYGTILVDLEKGRPIELLAVKRDYFCIQNNASLEQGATCLERIFGWNDCLLVHGNVITWDRDFLEVIPHNSGPQGRNTDSLVAYPPGNRRD